MKRMLNFIKSKDLYLALSRYFLGLFMIMYSITKILRTQFVVLPFALWQMPLESLSGKNIAWAFLGYSPWFQVLLGLLEFIPAILLLFRKTSLLGAMLMLPMTLSVSLINQALDLWDFTKLLSLILLALNILVLLFQWNKIKSIFILIVKNESSSKFIKLEVVANLLIIASLTYYSSIDLIDYKHQTNRLTGDWFNGNPNEWNLIYEKSNDSIVKNQKMKCYFGSYGEYSEINDSGFLNRGNIFYEFDEDKKTLTFANQNTQLETAYKCAFTDSTLQLTSISDSAIIVKLFKRRIINQ